MPTSSGLAPTITAAGITAGDFNDWQNYFIAQYQQIYGADSYLGNDSQDGQFIAVIAQALADCGASAIAVYNSFSPANAVGAGLSSNVKINGLERDEPSFSTVTLTIGGVANTPITNGQAIDANKNIWLLPSLVVIPSGGTINVVATAQQEGAITAAANTITGIQTPVAGWQTVTNAAGANPGAPVESDAALRVRQSASVALPSVTIFEGIVASLEQVNGVTRVKGYENNTGSTDVNGTAAHTLYFIVENGANSDIWNAIFEKITPGIGTRGAQSTTITDSNGSTRAINFDRPTNATINVAITLKALVGWQLSTEALITAALASYFETLTGGANISFLGLPSVALLPGTPEFGTFAITAMTIQKNSGSIVSADIQLAYNEMAVPGTTGYTVT